MAKVTMTGNVKDIIGIVDVAPVYFWTPYVREGVLSPRRQYVVPDATTGDFSVQLEAGPAIVEVGGKAFEFTAVAGDLWQAINIGIAVPPSTSAQKLRDAVDAWATSYGDSHYASPGFVGSAINALKDGVAATYDTLAKVAAKFGDADTALADRFTKSQADARFAPVSHVHPTTAIVDLAEYIQDTVAALIKGGANVTTSYDDAANTFTINATGGGAGSGTDPEVVRDTIGGALVAGSGISVSVDDPGDTITIAVAGVPQSAVTGLVAALANKSAVGHTHSVDDLTATGTKDGTRFLRDDNTWARPASLGATPGMTSAVWLRAVTRRTEKPVTVVTFADSRGDGTKPSAAVGVGATQLFPLEFAAQLRGAWGLGVGGRGYLPMQRAGADNTYQYPGPSLVSGAWAPVVGDTGIPGSQWIVPVGDGGRIIRVPLQPGCTSVDLISSAPGGGVHYVKLTGQTGALYQDSATAPGGANTDLVQFTKLLNPGSYVDITSPGGGWQALGVIEYVGDESSGVRTFNFAAAGITAADYAAGVGKAPFAGLLAKIATDMTVVETAINDIIAGRTAAQIVASVQALLSAAGGEPVVMTTPPSPANASAAGPVNTALRQIAATVVDIATLGSDTTATQFAGWFHTDNTHLKRTGAVGFADYLRRAVLGSTATSISNALPAPAASSGGNDARLTVTEHTIGDGTTPGPYNITHNQNTRSFAAEKAYRLLPPAETLAGLVFEHPSRNATVIRTDVPLPKCQVVLMGVQGTSDQTDPTAPTITSSAKTTTTIDVTASGSTDASGISAYNYWRAGVYIGTGAPGATFQHTGLTAGTDYVLTATAVDGAGNESAQSASITVKTTAAAPNVARIQTVRSRTVGASAGTAGAPITPAAGNNKVLLAFVTLSHAAWQSEASLDVKKVSDAIDGQWTKLGVAEYGTEQTGQAWVFYKVPTQLGTARTPTAETGKSGMANAHLIIDVIEFDNVGSLAVPVTNAKNNSTLNAVSITIPTNPGDATAALLIGSDGNALVAASGTTFLANTSNGEMDGTFDQAALCSASSTGTSTTYATANTKYATAAIGINLVRAQ